MIITVLQCFLATVTRPAFHFSDTSRLFLQRSYVPWKFIFPQKFTAELKSAYFSNYGARVDAFLFRHTTKDYRSCDGSVASHEDPSTGEATPYNPTPLWTTMQRLRVPKCRVPEMHFVIHRTLGRYIVFFPPRSYIFISHPLPPSLPRALVFDSPSSPLRIPTKRNAIIP